MSTADRPVFFDRTHTDDLIAFLAAAPSPYHAVAGAAERLEKAGFRQVAETDGWEGSVGGRYVIRGGALIAWYVPESAGPATPFRVVGTHTDSPNLRVKPLPDTGAFGWRQVAVEIYGGVPLNTWLDRDLGLSGRLVLRDGSTRLVQLDEPLLRVPQLAIHLDRQVNDGLKLDKQRHLTPIWGLGKVDEGGLIGYVAERAQLDASAVVGWDLMTHDVQPPSYLGRDRELLAAPRLDNLLSVHAATAALAAVVGADGADQLPYIPVLAAFDHEETGSESDTGAQGPLLGNVLDRSIHSAVAPWRTGPGRWPAPSASPPTWGTPCTPTTASGTSPATTRCPTAGRSSRSTSTTGTRPTAWAGRSSPAPASGRVCRGRASCPTTRCRAAPRSARSPPPGSGSPRSTAGSRRSPCTRRASCAVPRTRTCWPRR